MKHILLILFLSTSSGLFAQELLGREYWSDGTLRSTRYAEGAKIHFITYHENGKVNAVGCFLNGRRDGVWKQYSQNGVLLAQAGFRNGERQGIWEFRNEADLPRGQLTYSGGILAQGEAYDATGMITAQRAY
ncbi:MAG: hypothetical protein KBA60_06495 [Flavobacteriales bacterium]|nr:hypothetical protein [Flavobacteriales bacterium]MBP6643801.1 hypothetical protein [Flavobacteriales bacterium]MBP7155638.1 hypothetical protein [Flavobacteriales bacterium]HQV75598.1 hypothetical protein [Flavobacteriales bacterium]HQW41988.1 hypothetical protein [Flavobacteriales bacterium]